MELVFGIVMALVSGIFSLLWYLLRRKGEDQDHKLHLLFTKHDEDVDELNQLRIAIAGNHYQRSELDARFDKLESAFKAGFDSMGNKFDKLSDSLIHYLHEERKRLL